MPPVQELTRDRFAALTVVADGDGYVLGHPASADFVAVPAIGGHVVHWLQAGHGLKECARRAEDEMGEPVDVAGFVEGLTQAGLLPEETVGSGSLHPRKRFAGRLLFGPVGLAVQTALTAFGVVALIAAPAARPDYRDALASTVPLVSQVAIILISVMLGMTHELGHVLAAWAVGVSSRISISRRMIAIVFQTDLTRLWTVPRRRRAVPLLAGLLVDGAIVGLLVLAELTVLRGASPWLVHLARTIVFLNVGAVAPQFLIFLRTDIYALFVLATGSRNIWGAKSALLRGLVRRDTAADRALLTGLGPREVRWAKVFLALYVPGVLLVTWYAVVFLIPAVARLVRIALHGLVDHGIASLTGGAAAASLAITAASTIFIGYGLARNVSRLVRRV
jgi:putative peptide zinc metalloprotease protein